MEACAAGDPSTCPFTRGVGVSGVYFSFDSARPGPSPPTRVSRLVTAPGPRRRTAHTGPIGTVPRYAESGLVSDGDPALAFGPVPGSDGSFSFANGSRLYYANLTSNVAATRSDATFKGFEAVAVSSTTMSVRPRPATRPRGPRRRSSRSSPPRRSPTRSRSGPTTRRAVASSGTSTSAGPRSEQLPRPGAPRHRSWSPARATVARPGRRARSARRPTTA